MLDDLGVPKNMTKVSGSEGNSIPDGMTPDEVIEIKDTKRVSNTRQLRIQREHAQQTGRDHVIITGTNTNVSSTMEKSSTVIRRDDLGPQ